MQKVALEVSPLRSDFGNDIMLNEKLFNRIKSVYSAKDSLQLNQEQKRLLEETYKSFTRNGANLNPEQKAELKKIDNELAQLSQKFDQNVLGATNKFFLHITDTPTCGLTEFDKEMGLQKLRVFHWEGWVYTLQYPCTCHSSICRTGNLRKNYGKHQIEKHFVKKLTIRK
jgi:peptidyl-dipeptidase Dcp